MGYEDRDYYREQERYRYGGGGVGFRFNRDSIVVKLIVINLAVFVVDLFSPRMTAYDLVKDPPADLQASFEGPGGKIVTGEELKAAKLDQNWLSNILSLKTDRPWEVWSYLTHGFVHASYSSKTGIWHLIFNMVTLFFFGSVVADKLGAHEFVKFYLVAILIGGIGWMLAQLLMGGQGRIVGASGAVSAVTIYFVFNAPQANIFLMGIIPVKAWVVGVLFLVSNLMYSITASQIAWEAHLAGAAFGVAYYKSGWNFKKLQWPSGGSRIKIHDPGGVDQKLQEEADRVLDKINQHGEASLTSRERKTLNKYSKMIRKSRS